MKTTSQFSIRVHHLIISIYAFLYISLGCTNTSQLYGTWIIMEQQQQEGTGFRPVLRGTLIHFDDDILEISHTGSNQINCFPYWIDNDTIQTDSFQFGTILHQSLDSLIILSDTNTFAMKLLPLENTNFDKDDLMQLKRQITDEIWKIDSDTYDRTMYCDTSTWSGLFNSNSIRKSVVYTSESEALRLNNWTEYEWWGLKEFHGKLIFTFSVAQMDFSHLQLLESTSFGYSANLLEWFDEDWRSVCFEKNNLLKQQSLKREDLYGNWQIEEVVSPTHHEISVLPDSAFGQGMGRSRYYERLLSLDIVNDNLTFEFQKERYYFKAGERIIRNGVDWNLTKDGKFIYLDNPVSGSNFIQIEQISDDLIKLLKSEEIALDPTEMDYFYHVTLELILKNRE